MDESIVAIAKESAIRILERAAFLFSEDIPENQIPLADTFWRQKGYALDYSGPLKGELRIWLPESLSRVIVSNMLGLDEESEMAQKEEDDAVKEVLNIILGIFLTEAFGTEAVFHLGIPQMLEPDEWNESAQAEGHFWLWVENEPVLMSVHGGVEPYGATY